MEPAGRAVLLIPERAAGVDLSFADRITRSLEKRCYSVEIRHSGNQRGIILILDGEAPDDLLRELRILLRRRR